MIIPAKNFCTDGIATADTETSGYPASYAFDNTFTTMWYSTGGATPHWISYDLGVGITKIAKFLFIRPYYNTGLYVKDFQLEGSNDNTNWTVLLSTTLPNTNDFFQFSITNSTAYRYYRIYVTSNYKGNTNVGIYEIFISEEVNAPNFPSFYNLLEWNNLKNVTATDNSIIKTDPTYAFNTSGTSTLTFSGDGGVQFTIPTKYYITCGLTNFDMPSFISLQYGLYLESSGKCSVIESNVTKVAITGFYTNNDIFQILRISNTIYYLKNNICFYVSTTPTSAPLLFDTSIANQNGIINNVKLATTNGIQSLILNTAFASADSDDGVGDVAGNAVDNNIDTTTSWRSSSDFVNPHWWKYDFGNGNNTVLTNIVIRAWGDVNGYGIKNFLFQGSNDNSNWNTLLTELHPNNTNSVLYTFSNLVAYRYYRIYLSDSYRITGVTNGIYNVIMFHQFLSVGSTESIFLGEGWNLNPTGLLSQIFLTNLYTVFLSLNKFYTDLRASFFKISSFATQLNLKVQKQNLYNTDLRVRIEPYDTVSIGTLNDFLVKLDGIELLDVDYKTLIISLNLNTTPSKTEFTLARRHDNLDYMLNGIYSQITNENKIQVYDGSRLLFTGYISELHANSTNDTVKVIAEDIRCKLSKLSMELEYGAVWKTDSNHNGIPDDIDPDTNAWNEPDYIKVEINIHSAMSTLLTAIGSLISGIDNYSFLGSFCPEYTKSYNDYTSFLDQLIRQTANCNWYIDENEILRFQKIGNGTIKTLSLASLNERRHPYDLIISDVILNKIPNGYAQSLLVKRGYDIERVWQRQEFDGTWNFDPTTMQQLADLSYIDFQAWGGDTNNKFYVGINQTIYGYKNLSGWQLMPIIVVQWRKTENLYITHKYLPDIIVGSGLPRKTIYLQSYGRKVANEEWTEELYQQPSGNIPNTNPKLPYLVYKTEEIYDWQNYIVDLANFELSQNNKLQTSSTASMILDAYEYYNLNFMDLINFINTIQPNIYQNNNGFPLHIENIQINCATRIVTLNLSNYGKSWYVKTKSYLTSYMSPKILYKMPKQPVQQINP